MLAASPDEMRWAAAAEPLPEGRALGPAVILFSKIEDADQQ
jgi:hypothetical protein